MSTKEDDHKDDKSVETNVQVVVEGDRPEGSSRFDQEMKEQTRRWNLTLLAISHRAISALVMIAVLFFLTQVVLAVIYHLSEVKINIPQ